MAWRVTFLFDDRPEKTAEEAVQTLQKLFDENQQHGVPITEAQFPVCCNGRHKFGEDWEKGQRYITVRFSGECPNIFEIAEKAGVKAYQGG